ncbi:hypothetical protein N7537_011914 [Penicillium hordei]|uniref:Uncharacterized protein n=1 Tax=Penicillium hordei TaxID=40994 RepID=A0AAD6DN43_9EURO|nr:uncharacterized protein N7537_011914 [Penicillium hordei]KAJ5589236.1 hypothetical protein N7537_011914 [Penicillium hordei]
MHPMQNNSLYNFLAIQEDSKTSIAIMTNGDYGKLAIATAAILGILTLGALIYLVVWYVGRRLRTLRLRRQQSQGNDQFDQSAVSLAEDTSRTLDDFLMKDIQPERSSIMFRRSPSGSPSVTVIIDDTGDADHCKSLSQPYLTKQDTAPSSADTYTSMQTSTQESDPDDLRSDQTQWSSSGQRSSSTTPRASTSSSAIPTSRSSQIWTTTSDSTPSDQAQRGSSGQHSLTSTPRASISSSVIPTAGSSQVWTTTSAGTETFSLLSQSSNHSRRPPSPTAPSAVRSSQLYARRSSASGAASSGPASAGVLQSASRIFNEAEISRMAYSRNIHSARSMSPTSPISPVLIDVSPEDNMPQWTSVPPTPFPFGHV